MAPFTENLSAQIAKSVFQNIGTSKFTGLKVRIMPRELSSNHKMYLKELAARLRVGFCNEWKRGLSGEANFCCIFAFQVFQFGTKLFSPQRRFINNSFCRSGLWLILTSLVVTGLNFPLVNTKEEMIALKRQDVSWRWILLGMNLLVTLVKVTV